VWEELRFVFVPRLRLCEVDSQTNQPIRVGKRNNFPFICFLHSLGNSDWFAERSRASHATLLFHLSSSIPDALVSLLIASHIDKLICRWTCMGRAGCQSQVHFECRACFERRAATRSPLVWLVGDVVDRPSAQSIYQTCRLPKSKRDRPIQWLEIAEKRFRSEEKHFNTSWAFRVPKSKRRAGLYWKGPW